MTAPQAQPQYPEPELPKDPSSVTGLKFAKVLVWLVYAYFIIAVIILTLAFFLLLFNASTDAGFTQWVYRSADRVLEPFRGIFPSATADNGSVVDFAVLFAIIVYGILALLVQSLIHYIDRKIAEERSKARYLDAQYRQQQTHQAAQAQQQAAQQQAIQAQQAAQQQAAQAPPQASRPDTGSMPPTT
jgi:uncharacterized protein YggT (Ycf19 family)